MTLYVVEAHELEDRDNVQDVCRRDQLCNLLTSKLSSSKYAE